MSKTGSSIYKQKEKEKQKQKKSTKGKTNLINPAERKVGVNISMPLYVLDKIDEHCGDSDRSSLIVRILKRELKLS